MSSTSFVDGRDAALGFERHHEASLKERHDDLGPKAHGDPMGTPAPDERVIWKGRPDARILARTAFHTRSVAIYFGLLAGLALAFGTPERAAFVALLGIVGLGILHLLAFVSARTSLYILTDVRLILRIGMAIETRINVPLKQIDAANLRMRGKEYGDIALQLKGDRLLGYFLLWPHVRPFRFQHPQPMLRGIEDAQGVAAKLAEARSAYGAIDRNLTDTKDTVASIPSNQPIAAAHGEPSGGSGMEGAPA